MKPMPLAHFLPILEPQKPRVIEAPAPLQLVANNVLPPPEPMVETDAAAEAYELGLREGRAAAELEARSGMQDEERRFEARLAAAREEWCAEQAGLLADGVEKALAHIETTIADGAERILRQVIDQALRAKAVAQFAEATRRLLRDGEAGVVTLHGPADLLEAIRPALDGVSATIDYSESDGPEVWVRVDQTLIETRFAAWRAELDIKG